MITTRIVRPANVLDGDVNIVAQRAQALQLDRIQNYTNRTA